MSNLAKALGVAEGQEFVFEGNRYRIVGGERQLYFKDGFRTIDDETNLCAMIENKGEITVIPQYTPEVVEAAKAAVLLGYEWLAIDDDKTAYMYVEEPTDGHRRGWFTAGGYYGQIPSVALNNFPLGKYNLKEIAGVE